jgi:O-methyltransferase
VIPTGARRQSLESTDSSKATARELYLDLMKRCLTFYIWGEPMGPIFVKDYPSRVKRFLVLQIQNWLVRDNVQLCTKVRFSPEKRAQGLDHPTLGHTMIGLKRLDNIQHCVEDVLAKGVPGDLIETGVWRGGATIFMRAILKAYGVTDRKVWAADSFQGLPRPDPAKYPADLGDEHHMMFHLAVSLDEVKSNFASYGLLDEQVCFLKGWFKDTLPTAPIERLSVLRLDGDMYESTMEGLVHLYPKLSPGGYVIVDDYGYVESCRQAVSDFRARHGVVDQIQEIDWSGIYWQRT